MSAAFWADLWNNVVQTVQQVDYRRDVIDILIIATLIYYLLKFTKGTRAIQVIKGFGVILVATYVAQLLKLTMVYWVLDAVWKLWPVVLVVLFQPELRRALEHIGLGRIFDKKYNFADEVETSQAIAELQRVILRLAKRKIGALIVVEGKTGLSDIAESGTMIRGMVTSFLIENIFEPNTPLHDGAVIIQNCEIFAAGCFLPLSEDATIAQQLGTRHRAAIGVSEVADCTVFVVSEETGIISIAREGRLTRHVNSRMLRSTLEGIYYNQLETGSLFKFFKRRQKNGKID